MAMELWDPFDQAMSLRSAMDRLLQDSFVWPSSGSTTRGAQGMNLPLDVHESEDGYTLRASMPGIKPEDVHIQITGNTVTVRGQREEEREQKRGEQVILRERRMGSFARTITLPTAVDANKAEATIEHGELTLTLPKAQQAKPHRIPVKGENGRQPIEAQGQSGSGTSATKTTATPQ